MPKVCSMPKASTRIKTSMFGRNGGDDGPHVEAGSAKEFVKQHHSAVDTDQAAEQDDFVTHWIHLLRRSRYFPANIHTGIPHIFRIQFLEKNLDNGGIRFDRFAILHHDVESQTRSKWVRPRSRYPAPWFPGFGRAARRAGSEFVKVCGNFSRITGSDALVQITLPKKGIKGFNANFDFYQDVQTGEGGPKGFDGRSVLPVTFEVNLFDAFADADFPDQIHGLLIKLRKTSELMTSSF